MLELREEINRLKQEQIECLELIKTNSYPFALLKALEGKINDLKVRLTNINTNTTSDPEVLSEELNKLIIQREKLLEKHPKKLKIRIEKNDEIIIILEKQIIEEARKNEFNTTLSYLYPLEDSKNSLMISNVNEGEFISKYKQFYAVVNNLLQRTSGPVYTPIISDSFNEETKNFIYNMELVIITLLRNGYFNDDKIIINTDIPDGFIFEAAKEIMWLMKQLTSLANVEFKEPKIIVEFDNNRPLTFTNNTSNENCVKLEKVYKQGKYYFEAENRINYKLSPENEDACLSLLEYLFGFKEFKEGQRIILEHALGSSNTIGILPTGGGKSLIYQFTTMIQPKCAIIIAPITSLMDDQVYGLEKKCGFVRAEKIDGKNVAKIGLIENQYYFISPERVMTKEFRSQLYQLEYKNAVDTIVLDEVHCLSEWGHDFRISYLMLAATLKEYCADFRYLGLTATASNNVIKDIIVELELEFSDIVYISNLRRKNLSFIFKECENKIAMAPCILKEITTDNIKPTIVFVPTKGLTTSLATQISNTHQIDTRIYNGDAKEEQKAFIENKFNVLVATKAFGMGIDKPNIRKTIHYSIPGSMETFYQEAGRAGRDGNKSKCLMSSYKESDNVLQDEIEFFNPNNTIEDIIRISKKLSFTRLGTQIYFITANIKPIDVELNKIIELYIRILEGETIINETDNITSEVEKRLYILHKVGIVENWDVEYANRKYHLKVSDFKDNMNDIRTSTTAYLSKYVNVSKEIKMIKNSNSLVEILKTILMWRHENFTFSKIQQLKNMVDIFDEYANTEASDKIQRKFEDYFAIEKISDIFDLTFENITLCETITRALTLDSSIIDRRISQMQRVLESSRSNKIYAYYNILRYLKDPKNIDAIVELLKEEDHFEVMDSMININKVYGTLQNKDAISNLYYQLYSFEYLKIFNEHKITCEIYQKYYIKYINNILEG